MLPVRLSIVIPAYNEANCLDVTLQSISEWLRDQGGWSEILVVDDGSSDSTTLCVQQWINREGHVRLLRHEQNRGKGAAVRTGVLAARGDLVLVTDADLSTPIAEVTKLKTFLERGADVVIASRTASGAELTPSQGWMRQSLGKVFNRVVRALGLTKFHDTQCGFKLWRRSAADQVYSVSQVDGFAFDVEVLMLAERFGYSIVETGVVWANAPESRVRVVRDSLEMLWTVLKLRRQLSGRLW